MGLVEARHAVSENAVAAIFTRNGRSRRVEPE
jgi:hypothetical protein